jgi:ABC-type multidrug transport system ATPase subunit
MLSIENLCIKSNDKTLLELDSLQLQAGESMLLIGDNNSGKTLFLQTIHGTYRKYEGDIFIKEKPAFFYKKRKASIYIDYPFQLLTDKSIFKNITLPLGKVKPALQETIVDLCNLVELGEIYETPVNEFSRSDRKLIEIIRAIIQTANLVLIDDLDQYFDEKRLLKMQELITFGIKEKSSFIVTSKQPISLFDKKYRIQNGKVVML